MPTINDQVRNKLIYVCEDDPSIRMLEDSALSKIGHRVETFDNGRSFLAAFAKKKPDLCILDLMLPDIQGEEILKTIRSDKENDSIPVVIVSAKNLISDRVSNLDLGADDYIEKPFDILEFLARINARLRSSSRSVEIVASGFQIDDEAHKILYKGEEIHLTNSEFVLLQLLVNRAGAAVSRADMLQALWGGKDDMTTRTIDIHINNIRKKIGDPDGEIVKTVYGLGYMITKKEE